MTSIKCYDVIIGSGEIVFSVYAESVSRAYSIVGSKDIKKHYCVDEKFLFEQFILEEVEFQRVV